MQTRKEAAMPAMITDWRELAQRSGDGLEVTLLWSPSTDRVRVAVLDEELGTQLVRDVPGPDALRAFYHPYVYRTVEPFAHSLGRHPTFS
jgi:hypothetical protein